MSTERQARSTGPAPIRSPRSSAARKTAKFSDMRFTPRSEAALMVSTIRKSFSPGWAPLSRRIRSSDRPSEPQGTSCSTARTTPSSVAVASTQSSSPIRPRAIEKPRSVWPPRQESAVLTMASSSLGGISATRRTSAT